MPKTTTTKASSAATGASNGTRRSAPPSVFASVAPPNTPARMPTSVMPTCTVGRKRCGSSCRASAAAAPWLPARCIACRRVRRDETTASSLMASTPLKRVSRRTKVSSSAMPMAVSLKDRWRTLAVEGFPTLFPTLGAACLWRGAPGAKKHRETDPPVFSGGL